MLLPLLASLPSTAQQCSLIGSLSYTWFCVVLSSVATQQVHDLTRHHARSSLSVHAFMLCLQASMPDNCTRLTLHKMFQKDQSLQKTLDIGLTSNRKRHLTLDLVRRIPSLDGYLT